MSKAINKKKSGFTLIELLFALALLGFMLTIGISTFIGVFRFYNWSTNIRQSQQQARSLMETLTREIRLQKVVRTYQAVPPGVTIDYDNGICLNSPEDPQKSKSILLHFSGRIEVIKTEYTQSNCVSSSALTPTVIAGGDQLRVGRLSFSQVFGARPVAGTIQVDPSVIIDLRVATGARAEVAPGGGFTCPPADSFCGTANFITAVNGKHP